MSVLRCTLVADGSSDRALLRVIEWALEHAGWEGYALNFALGDDASGHALAPRVRIALERYPCDLLFVHRDAEKFTLQLREDEITQAIVAAAATTPVARIIPVRMTEAWLLHDEAAIRNAAGNPNGKVDLKLPGLKHLEGLPDPKTVLREALVAASGLSGQRLKAQRKAFPAMRQRVAELVEDWSPLRVLSAFQAFERSLGQALEGL